MIGLDLPGEAAATVLRLFWRHRVAEAGDEGALEELRTDDMEAIEAMIEALEGEESRKLIRLGMMLASIESSAWETFSNPLSAKSFKMPPKTLV